MSNMYRLSKLSNCGRLSKFQTSMRAESIRFSHFRGYKGSFRGCYGEEKHRTCMVVENQSESWDSKAIDDQSRQMHSVEECEHDGSGSESFGSIKDPESYEKRKLLEHALQQLQVYNPEFQLTAEVVEIIRVFFDTLDYDRVGRVQFQAMMKQLRHLDPDCSLISEHVRENMEREWIAVASKNRGSDGDLNDLLTFEEFCDWVMCVKEISPTVVHRVYTSWAKEIAMLDFGLSQEEDGMFVLGKLPDQFLCSHYPAHLVPFPDRLLGIKVGEEESNACQDPLHPSGAPTQVDLYPASRQNTALTMSKSFLAGSGAGVIAKSTLAPVDRIKIIFQVNEHTKFTFRNAFDLGKQICVQDGFRGLFRGNLLNLLRVIPYAGVQHSSFDFFRTKFHHHNEKHHSAMPNERLSNYQLVAAGSLSGGLSLIAAYPLDIVRARYVVQQGNNRYTSYMEAIKCMYKSGGARGFSKGLLPSLLGTLPYTGIGFSLNERLKNMLHELQSRGLEEPHPPLHPLCKFMCSYVAACVAQTCTYPIDTIRRRIQTEGYVCRERTMIPQYTGVITSARLIMAREGWRGFFKGVSVSWIRSPLATGISLTAYDLLKELMDVEKIA